MASCWDSSDSGVSFSQIPPNYGNCERLVVAMHHISIDGSQPRNATAPSYAGLTVQSIVPFALVRYPAMIIENDVGERPLGKIRQHICT